MPLQKKLPASLPGGCPRYTVRTKKEFERHVSHGYASADIIDGLGGIDHPACQMVIAQSLVSTDAEIKNIAQRILTKKNVHLFPDTLTYLLRSEDGDGEELALSLLEQNETAGHENGVVYPQIQDILSEFMSGTDGRMQRRSAVIVSYLRERTMRAAADPQANTVLFEKAQGVLVGYLGKIVADLTAQEAFENAVAGTMQEKNNAESAQRHIPIDLDKAVNAEADVRKSVLEMDIILPKEVPGDDEARALERLIGAARASETESYVHFNDLRILIRVSARQRLADAMCEKLRNDLETHKRIQERKKITDAEIAQKAKAAEEAERAKAAERVRQVEAERARADIARKKFNLKIS